MNNYYEKNAVKYIEETISADMSAQYDFFLKYMPKQGTILDIGFGSGRDMMYFSSLGYKVKGIDITPYFVMQMENRGYDVRLMDVENMEFTKIFDGIWACASLLHIKRERLHDVFIKCSELLKDNGIMYCSFKLGDAEQVIDGRYFNYVDIDYLKSIVEGTKLEIIDYCYTNDVRLERSDKWINLLVRKGEGDYELV